MRNIEISLKDKQIEEKIYTYFLDKVYDKFFIHVIDEIEKYNPNKFNNYLSVMFYGDKLIIGPFKKNEQFSHGCLKCFINNVKCNKGSIFDFSDNVTAFYNIDRVIQVMELCVDKYYEKKMEDIIVIDMLTLQQNVYETYKDAGCEYCYTDTIYLNSNEDCKVTLSNLRGRDFDEFINQINNSKLIVDNTSGIIRNHYRDSASRALPLVGIKSNVYNKQINSFGRTYDYKKSYYTAILEALERYSNAFPYRYPIYHESEEKLEKQNIKHLNLDFFSHHNYDLKNMSIPKLKKNEDINWIWVKSARTNQDVLIPEQIVYFDSQEYYNYKNSPNIEKSRFIYESSNGGALGDYYEQAVIYGLFEYIERDSFLVYWYNKLPPTKLNINYETIKNKKIMLYVGFLESIGYKLYCYDITLESKVPSIWVLIEYMGEEENKIAFYTAAGSNLDPEKALESALIECVTAIDTFQKNFEDEEKQKRRVKLLKDFSEVVLLQDHLLLYSNKEMRKHLEFAINTKQENDFNKQFDYYYNRKDLNTEKTIKEVLDSILDNILKYHEDVFIANTTNPNIASIDVTNVKVIIPSMLTMTFGHQNRRVNIKRIQTAPIINNLRKTQISIEEINQVPHPFP